MSDKISENLMVVIIIEMTIITTIRVIGHRVSLCSSSCPETGYVRINKEIPEHSLVT